MTPERETLSTDTSSAPRNLLERVEALERENRRWKRTALAVVAVLAAVAVVGMSSPPTKTLDLELLRIVDSRGKARAILGMGDEGPAISLLDEKGRLRANLGIEKEGPSLDLLDTAETPRAQLAVDGKQGPHLDFTDAKGVQASIRP
ncbi:MAG: hypothetical protein AABZ94_06220 [Candidatus Eisenbacteria bacterium]